MYKVSKRIAPTIFADTFGCNSCENYNLPYQSEFSRLLTKLVLMRQKPFHVWVRESGI